METQERPNGIATSLSVISEIRLVAWRMGKDSSPSVTIRSDGTLNSLQALRRLT